MTIFRTAHIHKRLITLYIFTEYFMFYKRVNLKISYHGMISFQKIGTRRLRVLSDPYLWKFVAQTTFLITVRAVP